MKTNDIRKAFLNYFQKNKHAVVPSSSLIPGTDPSLMFTTAGMVQFKDIFLGLEHRSYSRATTCQRCMRVSGKQNDLEEVGYTARHHTFFEMLGNFSFGDYFKREAIGFAWNFLTQELKIPANKLWVTVYKNDDDAANIWIKEMGVDPNRLSRCGEKDNFWAMGDTGPCGPCSEIYYDHGAHIQGGPPGSPEEGGDRYIELWNLVFMQFNRDAQGHMNPLPRPSIDTGMGLERVAAVMQGVHNNFEIDTFQHLIHAAAQETHCKDLKSHALKVLADHIRSTAFLISDGIIPSNEGRGYVLRRIMRRALRHGNQLDMKKPFFHKLVQPLIDVMDQPYPELKEKKSFIESVILQEEEQFARTLSVGVQLFEGAAKDLKSGDSLKGDVIFKLYDTYGFPVDLTGAMAKERGLNMDQAGFDKLMRKQQALSQASSQFQSKGSQKIETEEKTEFVGYETPSSEAKVKELFLDQKKVKTLNTKDEGMVILNQSPFYAECGGQVGDRGKLVGPNGVFVVEDTQKQNQATLHFGKVESGTINVGETLDAQVDTERRNAIELNHSATHLLQAALRQVLGPRVMQKGSLVEEERLRFDFSHMKPVTKEELQKVEEIVNQKIRENLATKVSMMSLEEAKRKGAMALFGEKYGEEVRLMEMGDFSKELCGGTHVDRSGDIGLFKITLEEGIAAGIRRIEAVTGKAAEKLVQGEEECLNCLSTLLKVPEGSVLKKVQQMVEYEKGLEKELQGLKDQFNAQCVREWTHKVPEVHGAKLLIEKLEHKDMKELRFMVDQCKTQWKKAVVVLASTTPENTVHCVAGVTEGIENVHAGEIIQMITKAIGGKGGGKKELAQGGGTMPEKLEETLASIRQWIQDKLNKK